MTKFTKYLSLFFLTMFLLFLTGCMHEEEDEGGTAPSSIIGMKMVQTVSSSFADPGINVVQPGDTVTYQFIDSTTIQGAGLETYPTTSWSYSVSGNTATVRLNYVNGFSEETLTFTSATGGTYRSFNQLNTGGSGEHEGTFTITDIFGGGGGGGDSACVTDNTGQISIYTSVDTGGGSISVSLDGGSVGTLTQLFTTGAPSCGAPSDGGVITRTLSAGTHSVTANNTNASWGPSNVSITQCGCLTFELN